jgi:RNA recognition motif-containing protein
LIVNYKINKKLHDALTLEGVKTRASSDPLSETLHSSSRMFEEDVTGLSEDMAADAESESLPKRDPDSIKLFVGQVRTVTEYDRLATRACTRKMHNTSARSLHNCVYSTRHARLQVPRSMGEAKLRPMFEEIGEIYELVIIRDKVTAVHRGTPSPNFIVSKVPRCLFPGCAFVTYCTRAAANAAIEKFHGKKTLPPVSQSIAMLDKASLLADLPFAF